MPLNDRLERLYARRRFGMRPGLERMQALMERLGNPERELVTIHVAGTNGKGSVVALAAGMLQACGFGRVGRYTSPHLLCFNERICIDGQPVEDAQLVPVLETVEQAALALDAADALGQTTFFECATAAAFLLFREAGVRLAVIETGLGGRLDATNVLLPAVSVITHIGLEHCEQLGHTLAAIAGEKAGIIKPGRPVVVGANTEEALAAIAEVARRQGAPLIRADESVTVTLGRQQGFDGVDAQVSTTERVVGRIRMPLAGPFQAENLCTAVAAIETFGQATGLPVPDEAFRKGAEAVVWPGRFQVVRRDPVVVVDGAHNPDAAQQLRMALKQTRFKGPVALVAGFCDDKDIAGCLRILAGAVRRAWAVPTPSARSLPAAATAELMRQAGIEAVAMETMAPALAAAETWAGEEQGMVVVCGSLFLVGAALQHYDAFPWRVPQRVDANEQLKA
ncbi:MAG: bifunctional folylpolyglutamate synthase/dihydrofolate synthase [Lentisphaerae bacterium]|jgi:dihydrofolate synthase/folylpolyglutamate synthase|nr:bifunctional folylpolyglutamate synthase/dihydrofolate synthase [Lentisphaerota bacterium]